MHGVRLRRRLGQTWHVARHLPVRHFLKHWQAAGLFAEAAAAQEKPALHMDLNRASSHWVVEFSRRSACAKQCRPRPGLGRLFHLLS